MIIQILMTKGLWSICTLDFDDVTLVVVNIDTKVAIKIWILTMLDLTQIPRYSRILPFLPMK